MVRARRLDPGRVALSEGSEGQLQGKCIVLSVNDDLADGLTDSTVDCRHGLLFPVLVVRRLDSELL